MAELNTHPLEQEPLDAVYEVVCNAARERIEAELSAYERYMTILRALTEAEILELVSGLGKYERVNMGQLAVVATDVIVNQPRLAMIIAQRYFDDCTSYSDNAVIVINIYLHDLWTGRAGPVDAIPAQILSAAAWHRNSHQRMIRKMTEN